MQHDDNTCLTKEGEQEAKDKQTPTPSSTVGPPSNEPFIFRCMCGLPAEEREARLGYNRGRMYYGCRRSRASEHNEYEQRCALFTWKDLVWPPPPPLATTRASPKRNQHEAAPPPCSSVQHTISKDTKRLSSPRRNAIRHAVGASMLACPIKSPPQISAPLQQKKTQQQQPQQIRWCSYI